MAVELLTYTDLAERLKVSTEAARALVKRHRLPRSRANDGKTLVSVDLSEIEHKPLPTRSPPGHRTITTPLMARIAALQAELEEANARAVTARSDYERERDRAEHLLAELLKLTAEAMSAKEAAARLEGEIVARRSRRWWQWRRDRLKARTA